MTRRVTRSKDREITIVKRRGKRDSQAEQQGGAWKVAFADFTLAMMALFMVLWIVQPLPGDKVPPRGEQDSNPLVDGGAGVFGRPVPHDGAGLQVVTRRRDFGQRDRDLGFVHLTLDEIAHFPFRSHGGLLFTRCSR